MVYKLKVYRLPLGTPQARGKALVNLLPLAPGETITIILPLPEDEEMRGRISRSCFATETGNVRRNSLADFTNVQSNGKIAMKLDEGDRLVGVRTCSEQEDVLLATRQGKCIRFSSTDVRVFSGRTSTGVRGINLAPGDEVISMSILTHVEATPEEREEYIKASNAKRRLGSTDYTDRPEDQSNDEAMAARLAEPRFADLEAQEEFILSVTENGYGKRTSAYEYPIKKRGGQGVGNIETSDRNGTVVATFRIFEGEHLMLVTDSGQIIRVPVDDISIMSRRTQGVTVFKVGEEEKVVSVSGLSDEQDEDEEDIGDDEDDGKAAESGEEKTDGDQPDGDQTDGN